MAKMWVKIAVKLFLVWTMVFCTAERIHADELSTIKDGYNSYWSKIKDGKGSCTVIRQRFTAAYNPEVPQYTIKDDYEWMFAGLKINYRWKTPLPNNSQGPSIVPGADIINEVYFDGQRVTAGSWKNFVLRKPNISDIGQTNQWDPRLVVTGSTRGGESWEPVPFWREGNSKIVGKEKVNGYDCYVLETTTDSKNNGQVVRRSWFDIERNYCLVRSEIWFSAGKDVVVASDLKTTKDSDRRLLNRIDIELKKYGKELWGPKKYERIKYDRVIYSGDISRVYPEGIVDSKNKTFYISQKVTIIYNNVCAYNLGLTENDLKIVLAPDAKISDASKYPTDYVKPKVSIEFRTTKNISSPGFTQVNTPDTNEKVYVSDKAEITEADISGVKVDYGMGSLPQLQMSFTEKGIEKLAKLTQDYLNERIAVFIDGKLIELPVIKEKIPHGTSLTLSGRFTEAEIKRILGDEVK